MGFFGGGGTVLCCEMFRLTSKRTQLYQHNELTANVDFQFTQVCLRIFNRKLYDEVSIGRQAAVALQKDCGTVSNSARVLTTDGVVPQCRCRDERWDIGQTDDEIVRSVTCTKKVNLSTQTVASVARQIGQQLVFGGGCTLVHYSAAFC